MNYYYSFIIIILLFSGCSKGELRGNSRISLDKKTYLIIADDNGGECGDIFVDGKKWNYKLQQKRFILSGVHTIECGTEIEFIIKEGTTFTFDYWGP